MASVMADIAGMDHMLDARVPEGVDDLVIADTMCVADQPHQHAGCGRLGCRSGPANTRHDERMKLCRENPPARVSCREAE